MRGDDRQQAAMFSYLSPEQRVPADHPLRPIRQMVDDVLRGLSPQFDGLYARTGRPSIPPEKLLRALLVQLLYSVRSERQLMEQLAYNLLFRWFVGLNMDDPVWDATVFTKNRERLLAGDIAQGFFDHVLAQAYARDLVSEEHFSVDGTLLKAWASQKSFQPKPEAPPADAPAPSADAPPPPAAPDRNPAVDFHGHARRNDTHQSTTEPEARLYRKGSGQPAELSYLGHVLMENRNGLAVQATVTPATGTAEREAALAMLPTLGGAGPKTLAGDRAYDTQAFVADLRALGVTPHVTQHTNGRRSAIDGRTTRHPGYALSLQVRKRIEEIFGWLKTVALMRKQRHRGLARVRWLFILAVALYNLVRIRNLEGAP
jgi:transposase